MTHTIRHLEGNAFLDSVEGARYDLFAVSDGENETQVTFVYASDDHEIDSFKVNNSEASRMRGINGSLHLISSVTHTVLKGFTEHHSFFYEQFYDEDGNHLTLSLIVLDLS